MVNNQDHDDIDVEVDGGVLRFSRESSKSLNNTKDESVLKKSEKDQFAYYFTL